MKRILSLLFALVITISLFNFTVASAHTGALNDEEKTLLELVGVIDEEKELDDYLTRGEFAEMLAKVAFGLNADAALYNNGKKVVDVWTSDSYYDEVNAMYNRGYITADSFGYFYPEREITPEEAENHPYKHVITRAIGIVSGVDVDSNKLENYSGETILLCSDGLTTMVSLKEIENVLNTENPEDVCEKLIELANEHGGKDNITVILLVNDSEGGNEA